MPNALFITLLALFSILMGYIVAQQSLTSDYEKRLIRLEARSDILSIPFCP